MCVLQASGHSDPLKVYNDLHSSGVGLQLAPLYISWAQQCESRNLTAEAEQVYQKALENRAEPLDTVQRHYRSLQIFSFIVLSFSSGHSTSRKLRDAVGS